MNQNMNRRQFLGTTAIAGAGVTLSLSQLARAQDAAPGSGGKPALLGGKPVRSRPPREWPIMDEREDQAMLETVRSGKWFRGNGPNVQRFEQAYAKVTGAKHCLATNSGTSALFTSLAAVGVSAGDEVIVAPYTFIATVNVILLHHALPIFVDTDPETLQIDARKIEAAITDRTTAIVPVHLGGSAADLDTILAVAKKHKLPVVEDACQSHLAQWRGRALGTWGDTGCFSFQASKNLNCGDGGAVLTNSDEWADKCYSFHNQCRPRPNSKSKAVHTTDRGGNFRMTEFQATILLAQMTRLEDQMKTREQNAAYLRGLLKEIPGIVPARMYDGCTRNAYHIFMYRYQKEHFAGSAAEALPGGAQGRGRGLQRGLRQAEPGRVHQAEPRLALLAAALPRRDAGQVGGTHRLPRQRQAFRGGRLVHPNHPARTAQRHGPDGRSHPQDPEARRRTGLMKWARPPCHATKLWSPAARRPTPSASSATPPPGALLPPPGTSIPATRNATPSARNPATGLSASLPPGTLLPPPPDRLFSPEPAYFHQNPRFRPFCRFWRLSRPVASRLRQLCLADLRCCFAGCPAAHAWRRDSWSFRLIAGVAALHGADLAEDRATAERLKHRRFQLYLAAYRRARRPKQS